MGLKKTTYKDRIFTPFFLQIPQHHNKINVTNYKQSKKKIKKIKKMNK